MKPMRLVLTVIALLGCFTFGFGWRDIQSGRLPNSNAVSGLLGGVFQGKQRQSANQIFEENYRRIIDDYIRPVDRTELKYAAIHGMMASLGDPHTSFLVPREASQFSIDTDGKFVGIGARLAPDPLGAKLTSVFENGPAARSGVRAGDIITSVDGVTSAGQDVEDMVNLIRGKEGTTVRLTLLREGAERPIEVSVRRETVITPTVESKLFEDQNVGYISVSGFSDHTPDQFDNALVTLLKRGANGFIIDLRDNPGGRLDSVVEMLSRFHENDVAVTMVGRTSGKTIVRLYDGYKRRVRGPVVVLVNAESASASEIFAGGLRDYGIATIVGTHTYGKAAVQNVWGLVDNSNIKITVAKYLLPRGGDISRKVDADGAYVSGGIQPDILVEEPPDAIIEYGEPESDIQLARALEEVLRLRKAN